MHVLSHYSIFPLDYYAPSKPTLICVGAHEIVCTWKAPIAPAGRINGYEVMCNGKVSWTFVLNLIECFWNVYHFIFYFILCDHK